MIILAEFDFATRSFNPLVTSHHFSTATCMCFVRRDDESDALLIICDNTILEYNIGMALVERKIKLADVRSPRSICCAGDAIVVGGANCTICVYSYGSGKLEVVMPLGMSRLHLAEDTRLFIPTTIRAGRLHALSADGSRLHILGNVLAESGTAPGWIPYTYAIVAICMRTGVERQSITFADVEYPLSMLLCADGSFVIGFLSSVRVFDEAGQPAVTVNQLSNAYAVDPKLAYLPRVGIVSLTSRVMLGVLPEDPWYSSLHCAFIEACLFA